MLHGGSHHQEGHGDADGDEHLDQLGHPGVGPVTLINDLHGEGGGGGGGGGCPNDNEDPTRVQTDSV